jgi:hypothetical protein
MWRRPPRITALCRSTPSSCFFPVPLHALQLFPECGDAAPDHAPVGLQLGLPGPAQSDATANTRQVDPHSGQAGQQVLELRQLDLELGLLAARARGEDVEDDLGAVHHAAP